MKGLLIAGSPVMPVTPAAPIGQSNFNG